MHLVPDTEFISSPLESVGLNHFVTLLNVVIICTVGRLSFLYQTDFPHQTDRV